MPGRRGTGIAVLASLTLAVASACDDRLSKPQFITRAEKVCAGAERRMHELEVPAKLDGFRRFFVAHERITNEAASEIRELGIPEPDRAEVEAVLDDLQRAASLLPEAFEAVTENDAERVEELRRASAQAASEALRGARSYGLKGCVGQPSPSPTSNRQPSPSPGSP